MMFKASAVLSVGALGVLSAGPCIGSDAPSLRRLDTPDTYDQTVIPHNLFFSTETDILETKEPKDVYENVLKTIQKYRDVWGETGTKVTFLTDKKCQGVMLRADRYLMPYYLEDKTNQVQKDNFCAACALYLEGGYYFGRDLEVEEVFVPAPDKTFVSAQSGEDGDYFQGFIAAAPHNAVVKNAMRKVKHLIGNDPKKREEMYETQQPFAFYMKDAFQTLKDEEPREAAAKKTALLLEKASLGEGKCNEVVRDPESKKVFFYKEYKGETDCKREVATVLPTGEEQIVRMEKEQEIQPSDLSSIIPSSVNPTMLGLVGSLAVVIAVIAKLATRKQAKQDYASVSLLEEDDHTEDQKSE